MTRITCFFALTLVAAVSGCGQSGEANSQAAQSTQTAEKTANLVAPSNTDSQSPAFQSQPVVSPTAEPTEVVSLFLDSLRSGEETVASALLTEKARIETEKENLVVQPPGTPESQFAIGNINYVSGKRDMAHVSSVFTLPDDQGYDRQYEVTWIVRREENRGWRIAGMATQLVPKHPPGIPEL